VILTQGPRRNANAWTGKKLWIDRNLGPDTDVTITRDKGLVYGKVLVDDLMKRGINEQKVISYLKFENKL
jgi:hypothetical protein